MTHKTQVDRRGFLAATTAAMAVPTLIPSHVLAKQGKPGANDRITTGHIGVGGMGTNHLRGSLEFEKLGIFNIAAVCDADEKRLKRACKTAEKPGVMPYRDYRYVLDRKDIDAVFIATPDHWHAVQCVHACNAGKHVYVEKPASVAVRDGQMMVDAARRNKRAVQVGAQGRTGVPAYWTCRAIRNGMIGRVNKVTCWHYETPYDENPVPDCDPPAELDWDLWLGPLSWRSYNPKYCHATFRWLLESGGGQIRDRGAHQFSTIMWCMDADHQISYTVDATGTPPPMGLWNCPVTMEVSYKFTDPDWELVWSQPGDPKIPDSQFGQIFSGEKDTMLLDWEGARKTAPPGTMEFELPPGGEDPYRTAEFDDFGQNHKADWIKAIKEPDYLPAVDIEIGHRVATMCNLGNLSYVLGRKLVWDGVKQEVVDDPQANMLLSVPQRYPYCF